VEFDFIVIGAGSAGCAVAAGLAKANIGSVCVLEAGSHDAVPQVKIPFGLLYTMGSKRDWKFLSTAQSCANNRVFKVNRGLMIGGSSSINSMVWFRGRKDDFDNWRQPGWRWDDVEQDFLEIEQMMRPQQIPSPHPLSLAFAKSFRANSDEPPTPERESAGLFNTNSRNGRRWSAADAFLRPAMRSHGLEVITRANVNRISFDVGRMKRVELIDGRVVSARRGIVLSAGSIGSPSILMRSGIGPAAQLTELGISINVDSQQVGQNLSDHPVIGVHHEGRNSGYGLVWNQSLQWAMSPFHWLAQRKGRLTSNFVEAGAFFRVNPATPEDDRPEIQVHFIPYMMGYKGKSITYGSGYFADVAVCRPASRGSLTLSSADPRAAPNIDLGVLKEEQDVLTLVGGFRRLRELLANAPMGGSRAPEVYPGSSVTSDEEITDYVRSHSGTAYHPVGTLAMGEEDTPVTRNLQLRGVDGLWVADASVMPRITSANTNAPSMMIGHRAAKLILDEVKN
jgi:choline dehydrogenase